MSASQSGRLGCQLGADGNSFCRLDPPRLGQVFNFFLVTANLVLMGLGPWLVKSIAWLPQAYPMAWEDRLLMFNTTLGPYQEVPPWTRPFRRPPPPSLTPRPAL